MIMLAVDKSLLNWKIVSFKKLSLIVHNMVITYSSPEKNNIYIYKRKRFPKTSNKYAWFTLVNLIGLMFLFDLYLVYFTL